MKNLLCMSAMMLSLAGAALAEDVRAITVMGYGTAAAVPDMASVDIGVTHEAPDAGEALARTSEALGQVMALLEQSGVEARDMQTHGLSVQPVWARPAAGSEAAPRITGFVARNGLMVRVRDLDKLGQILDSAVQDGANTFNGVQFSMQDTEAAMAEARAMAVKDAMARASQLAQAAGVTLGPVLSISEGAASPRPVMMEMAAARMASDVPVAAGEVSLAAHVTMVYRIAD